MKRVQIIFAVLAAVTGIGAAYASQPKASANSGVYRWHTVGGKVVFTVSTAVASGRCIKGTLATCLYGTRAGAPLTIIRGTFQ